MTQSSLCDILSRPQTSETDHVKRCLVAGGVALCLATSAAVVIDAQRGSAVIQPNVDLARPAQTCATGRVRERRLGWRLEEALADGRPLSFTQEPSVLSPGYAGTITFRDLYVAGDIATISFKPFDPEAPADQTDTWTRTGTTTMNGRLVSVFNPSWPASRLGAIMRRAEWGFDYPFIYWGEVIPDGVAIGNGYHVYLRMASTGLPNVSLNRLAEDVQYSGNVVNIRYDDFASPRLAADEDDFAVTAVTRRFYELFEDSYDTIAMTTQDIQLSRSYAFHRNIKNEVSGIGEQLFNNSADYGSGGRLSSVEIFYGPHATSPSVSPHEAAHQWAAYIDWTRLNGLVRAGHQPSLHDPLMSGGETYLGAVLDGRRRVARTDTGWAIERTPAPIRFHSLTLYAMGVLPKEQVPEITLFGDQGQLGGNTLPNPGTAISGSTQTVTIFNVIGMIGERSGPVPSEWHRAIVVVSRGRLLTQEEMNYWTFFVQRLADPNRSQAGSYDGFVSFDAATGNTIDLKHDIRPKTASAIGQALQVDYPNFSAADLRDFSLDAPLPTLLSVGQRLRVSGRITSTERSDWTQIQMYLVRDGGGLDGFRMIGNVSSNGSFVMEETLQESHRGRFMLQVYALSPGAPPQFPRTIIGPFTVN